MTSSGRESCVCMSEGRKKKLGEGGEGCGLISG